MQPAFGNQPNTIIQGPHTLEEYRILDKLTEDRLHMVLDRLANTHDGFNPTMMQRHRENANEARRELRAMKNHIRTAKQRLRSLIQQEDANRQQYADGMNTQSAQCADFHNNYTQLKQQILLLLDRLNSYRHRYGYLPGDYLEVDIDWQAFDEVDSQAYDYTQLLHQWGQ